MTDRERGNTDAPGSDVDESRARDDSAPRRVGDVREEREAERSRREAELGTSWIKQVPQQSLGTILTVSGILALLVPFVGGALGGAKGASTGRQRPPV